MLYVVNSLIQDALDELKIFLLEKIIDLKYYFPDKIKNNNQIEKEKISNVVIRKITNIEEKNNDKNNK